MESGLADGAWEGRNVFIIGGGPSLRGVDLSFLSRETTLGLNMAFLHNPTAALVYDKRLLDSIGETLMWSAYQGVKLWLNSECPAMPDDIVYHGARQLREARRDPAYPRWPRKLSDGIYRGNNAGSAGICLADVLGADYIYLLGYDLRVEAGMPANWHDLYPEEWRAKEQVMQSYRADLARVATMVRARVFNLTPGSALQVFPRAAVSDVLPVRP